MTDDVTMISDEARLVALGRVVDSASKLDFALRSLFCNLIGSKFAAVVAGGQMTTWLIENCKAVVKVHDELSDDQRLALDEILSRSKAANTRRNRYVHDLWGISGDGSYEQLRSRVGSHDLEAAAVSIDDVEKIASELAACGATIRRLESEIWREQSGVEVQLRWEDHLRSMTDEDLAALMVRRIKIARQQVWPNEATSQSTPAGMSDRADSARQQATADVIRSAESAHG